MSDRAGVLPKWFSNWGIILAKEQLDHIYTFWAMPIMIFSPVQIIMGHPLGSSTTHITINEYLYLLRLTHLLKTLNFSRKWVIFSLNLWVNLDMVMYWPCLEDNCVIFWMVWIIYMNISNFHIQDWELHLTFVTTRLKQDCIFITVPKGKKLKA